MVRKTKTSGKTKADRRYGKPRAKLKTASTSKEFTHSRIVLPIGIKKYCRECSFLIFAHNFSNYNYRAFFAPNTNGIAFMLSWLFSFAEIWLPVWRCRVVSGWQPPCGCKRLWIRKVFLKEVTSAWFSVFLMVIFCHVGFIIFFFWMSPIRYHAIPPHREPNENSLLSINATPLVFGVNKAL